MKKTTVSALVSLTLCSFINADCLQVKADDTALEEQIRVLNTKIDELAQAQNDAAKAQAALKEEQKYQAGMLSRVNAQSANDNIKWDLDFRSAYHNLNYKDVAGETYSNPSLLTNRVWLGLGSKVNDRLFFNGQIAAYYNWGADTNAAEDKLWQQNSRPNDTTIRLRQAYFVYKLLQGDLPVNISVGRRAAVDGFLANHREGTKDPGSPLAHITNMEVDGAMMQLTLDHYFLPGSYLKVVYGRAHDPAERGMPTPYLDDTEDDDKSVDFIVVPMSLYANGTDTLMAQYSMIMNSKGERINDDGTTTKKMASGTTHLAALSYQREGINEDIEFLEEAIFFASAAMSVTDPKEGFQMLGSEEGKTGYSYWVGLIVPDMITDEGKLGFEYNYGTEYWTPMTWAEDSVIGSKIATRGSAYEAYWNLPIEGKNLTAQLRYTYLDYDYRANTTCYWDDPAKENLDTAQELRVFLRYRY